MRFENIHLLEAGDGGAGYLVKLQAEWRGAPVVLALKASRRRGDVLLNLGDSFSVSRFNGETEFNGEGFSDRARAGMEAYVQRLSVDIANCIFTVGAVQVSYERGTPMKIEDLGDHSLGKYVRAVAPCLEVEEDWEADEDLARPSTFASYKLPDFLGKPAVLQDRVLLRLRSDRVILPLPDGREYAVNFSNAEAAMPDYGMLALDNDPNLGYWMIGAPLSCQDYWPHQVEVREWVEALYRDNLGEDFILPSSSARYANELEIPTAPEVVLNDVTWEYSSTSLTLAGDVLGADLAIMMSCTDNAGLPMVILNGHFTTPKVTDGEITRFTWPKDRPRFADGVEAVTVSYLQLLLDARSAATSKIAKPIGHRVVTDELCDGLLSSGVELSLVRAYAHDDSRWQLAMKLGPFTCVPRATTLGGPVAWSCTKEDGDAEALALEENTRLRTPPEVAAELATEAGLEVQYDFMGFLVEEYLRKMNFKLIEWQAGLGGNVGETEALALFNSWDIPLD